MRLAAKNVRSPSSRSSFISATASPTGARSPLPLRTSASIERPRSADTSVEAHEGDVRDTGLVPSAPLQDEALELVALVAGERPRGELPHVLVHAVRREEQGVGVLAELLRREVVVDPHLALERDHQHEVDQLGQRIRVRRDVVDRRDRAELDRVGDPAFLRGLDGARELVAGRVDLGRIAVGERVAELVELLEGGPVAHGLVPQLGARRRRDAGGEGERARGEESADRGLQGGAIIRPRRLGAPRGRGICNDRASTAALLRCLATRPPST